MCKGIGLYVEELSAEVFVFPCCRKSVVSGQRLILCSVAAAVDADSSALVHETTGPA